MRNWASDVQMTPFVRDEMILDLRRKGHTYREIGRAVGMNASSVYRAWRRLQAGGQGTRPRGLI